MKTVLTKILALSSVALLMLPACKKNEALVTSNGGKAGALTASVTSLPLDKTKLADPTPVINFAFTAPNYGFTAAVSNTLQIDLPGDNWKNPTSATLGTKVYSQGYNTADFNNLILKLNVPAGVATPVVVRVMHTISTSVAPIYSNVLSLTVTAFNLTSYVYVTGQFSGWENPGTQEDSLVSVTGNGIYVGIINFTAGNNQFLILPVKNWNNKYATSGTSTPSSTVTYNASNNLNAPTVAGQYLVTFNLNAGTISFALADYYSVIGDAALGWSTDVPMKYVNDGNGNWTVTTMLSSTGSFKVRQDDAWSNSWGIPNASTAGAGVANTLNDTKNSNITVPTSGTHTVTFNMPATPFGTTQYTNLPTYTNATFPFVTTTYTYN